MSLKQISILVCISFGATHVSAGTKTGSRMPSPCPDSPNCVSSLSKDKKQFVKPLKYSGSIETARLNLINILENSRGARLVKTEKDYLHVEFRSLIFRFVDDVQFFLPTDESIIHIKSASRSGYYDFGTNRRRVERLRAAFNGSVEDEN